MNKTFRKPLYILAVLTLAAVPALAQKARGKKANTQGQNKAAAPPKTHDEKVGENNMEKPQLPPQLEKAYSAGSTDNQLTDAEKSQGWELLFDGTSIDKWRGVYQESFPHGQWIVQNGVLMHLSAKGAESAAGGDIITKAQYTDFELQLDFNISEGGNSGIKYFVVERQPRPKGSAIGLEFQILDDERHPDAKMGRDGNRTVGSLYDLITANRDKRVKAPGNWNEARIISRGGKVQHYLNGQLVVEYDRFSDEFRKLRSMSKYAPIADFGEAKEGHILLQDHGDLVGFKNIKIRPL